MLKVSVIVPVYNVQKYVSRCLNSILQQSYENIEVIVVDDGSTDKSLNICETIAKKDSRIIIVHTENFGVSHARNIGLNIATGYLTMFVDSDDTIQPDLVEILVNTYEQEVDCVICGCNIISEKSKLENVAINIINKHIIEKKDAMEELCYMKNSFENIQITAVWGRVYRTVFLKNISFNENMSIGEDFVFNYEVFKNINKIALIDYCGYNYFIYDGSAMRSGFNERKVKTIEELEKLSLKYGLDWEGKCILARLINIAIVLLLSIPIEEKYATYRNKLERYIKKYRLKVLLDCNVRLKLKIALLISFFGVNNMQRLFYIIKL